MDAEPDDAQISALLQRSRRIAVLGIKTDAHAAQPAFYVPQYMQQAGYTLVPVPVYYPDVQIILGQPVYRRLMDIPERVDMVNVFRRPQDLPAHVDDILAARPHTVWFQLGIRNDDVAVKLCEAGIRVVQNRCLMVEHRRLLG